MLAVTLLTFFCLIVHGYHPYSEDGGLYVAGILKLLHPELFPRWPEFVTEHLRFSLFAPLVAGLVRVTGVSLPWVLLVLYLLSVWLTLGAAWLIAVRLIAGFAGRLGAVGLLACWLTIPIAGTSLMLMDPYLTARSFSTPLSLAAIACSLDLIDAAKSKTRAAVLSALALLGAALMHPLMAGYALGTVIVTVLGGSTNARLRRWSPWLLGAMAMGAAAVIQSLAPAESADYVRIALTRYYWFPLRWQWYEQIGLVAPLLILWTLLQTSKPWVRPPGWTASLRAGLVMSLIALAVALAFARAGLAAHLLARLQPLRSFQMVYVVMTLAIGAWLGETLLQAHRWPWAAFYLGFGALMFFVAVSTYPASAHVELPFGDETRTPHNAWERAFVWARDNTPQNALFALDSHYITRDGEDAQCFRAIAERSMLPDYSKDGGEASITPSLTGAWVLGQIAQSGLNMESDADRLRKLSPNGVTWVVLNAEAQTGWNCPYRNEAAKVCRVP